jgi:hypothetical protein
MPIRDPIQLLGLALLEFASLQYVTTPVADCEVAIRIIIGNFEGAMPQID